MEKYFDFLSQTELFDGIGEEGLHKMFDCMGVRSVRYATGEFLLRPGDKPSAVGLVLSGEVHIVKEDFWGNNFILTDVKPGQTFAEASSILGNQPLLFGAVAKEPTEVLFLPVLKLYHVCSSGCGCHQKLIENLLVVIAGRNLLYEQKCEHLSRRSTREKLLSFLSEQSALQKSDEFEIPYNRQQLADYLSVDRSAMSQELSRMQSEGMLEYHKSRFRLFRTESYQ